MKIKKIIVLVVVVMTVMSNFCTVSFAGTYKTYSSSGFTRETVNKVFGSFMSLEGVQDYINDTDYDCPYYVMYAYGGQEYDGIGYVPEYIYFTLFADYEFSNLWNGDSVKLVVDTSTPYMCPSWRCVVNFTEEPYTVGFSDFKMINKNTSLSCYFKSYDNPHCAVVYETNKTFYDDDGTYLNDFFILPHTFSPTPEPTAIPIPITPLEELTPTAIMEMGKTQIMAVVKKILILVFGTLCLVLLAPLVKRLLQWLRRLVSRL